MNIAIDARWIFPEISGIGAYTRELIRNLAVLDRNNSYVLFFDSPSVMERTLAEAQITSASNFSTQLLSYGVFSIRNQFLLPNVLRQNNIDVYHSANYMIPLPAFPRSGRGRTKCVATIHDVIPMIFPSHAPKSKKARLYPVYRWLMVEIGRRANAIIADSQESMRDVIKHLRIPPASENKVRAIYCGVAERFQHPLTPRKRKAANEQRIVLYVGRADPYKNLEVLIKAFATARAGLPFPAVLIIAGAPDPRYPEAEQLATELGIADMVRWTGYLADSDLVSTYQNADVLVHPSRYEGFGLQVAEAMACGLPVICSNAGALPEVAGDAAIMLPPDDVSGFAQRIVEVLTDDDLSKQMSGKGSRQADKFTWKKTTAETLAVYEETHNAQISG